MPVETVEAGVQGDAVVVDTVEMGVQGDAVSAVEMADIGVQSEKDESADAEQMANLAEVVARAEAAVQARVSIE